MEKCMYECDVCKKITETYSTEKTWVVIRASKAAVMCISVYENSERFVSKGRVDLCSEKCLLEFFYAKQVFDCPDGNKCSGCGNCEETVRGELNKYDSR